jgi:pSer/pThr/pTyr-binding forkhead associated (FHA) protein
LKLVLVAPSSEATQEIDDSGAVVLGRSQLCDFIVTHSTVSRRHAAIQIQSNRLVLKDLNSTNGTYINDVPSVGGIVSSGDRICLGSAELLLKVFQVSANAEAPPRTLRPPEKKQILAGVADQLKPADLVQVLASGGKTGSLMLRKGRFGRVDFKDGQVCYAKVDGIEGEKAFHRIMTWEGAEFRFCFARPKEGNLEQRTDVLLVNNARLQEEMKDLEEALPDPATELLLVSEADTLPLTSLEREVIRATPEVKTLRGIFDASPLPDPEIAKAVVRLLASGILSVNPTETATATSS